mmetsp:Transcript_7101/g.20813  ORF Transcript_7101/g.20813 Transcript_7101/m.20813 type:complete len:359 (+) Transcript_7101:823-1899(+)
MSERNPRWLDDAAAVGAISPSSCFTPESAATAGAVSASSQATSCWSRVGCEGAGAGCRPWWLLEASATMAAAIRPPLPSSLPKIPPLPAGALRSGGGKSISSTHQSSVSRTAAAPGKLCCVGLCCCCCCCCCRRAAPPLREPSPVAKPRAASDGRSASGFRPDPGAPFSCSTSAPSTPAAAAFATAAALAAPPSNSAPSSSPLPSPTGARRLRAFPRGAGFLLAAFLLTTLFFEPVAPLGLRLLVARAFSREPGVEASAESWSADGSSAAGVVAVGSEVSTVSASNHSKPPSLSSSSAGGLATVSAGASSRLAAIAAARFSSSAAAASRPGDASPKPAAVAALGSSPQSPSFRPNLKP